MVARLLTGILAAVFLPLGVVFTLIGLLAEDVDRGEPEGFLYAGLPIAAVGAAFAIAFVVLMRRERGRRARRTQQASAEVLEASINHGVQLNTKRQLTLTVRFPAAGEVTGKFFWYPSIPVGEQIEVRYDPDEPANFEPVDPTGGTGIMGA